MGRIAGLYPADVGSMPAAACTDSRKPALPRGVGGLLQREGNQPSGYQHLGSPRGCPSGNSYLKAGANLGWPPPLHGSVAEMEDATTGRRSYTASCTNVA